MGGEAVVGAMPALVVALDPPRPPWRQIIVWLVLCAVGGAWFAWGVRSEGMGRTLDRWTVPVIVWLVAGLWMRLRARRTEGPAVIQVGCRLLFPEPGFRGERVADLFVRPAALRIVRGSLERPKGEQWVIPWSEIGRVELRGRPDAPVVELTAVDGELLARLRAGRPAEVVLARFAAVGITPASELAADT